ncbi:radical SAM protein, partial [bacterium]|nr:radical SAM protein [candidate division CSSED10-310 bacterium]
MELDLIARERLRRLRCWGQGTPMAPIRLELEPTDRCNLSCRFCWRQDPVRIENSVKTEAEEIPDERLMRLVDEACDMGIMEWRIGGGGEPMLKRRVLVPMMKQLKERGVTGLLTTNGTVFEEQDIRDLVAREWDLIEFSIDGPDASVHDPLRGRKGSFERSVAALRLFHDEKKRQGKRLPRLAINTVLVNDNFRLIPAMIEMCREYGVEVFSLNPITIFAPDGERLKLNDAERREFQPLLIAAMENAGEYGIANSLVDLADMELVAKTGEMTEVLLSDSRRTCSESGQGDDRALRDRDGSPAAAGGGKSGSAASVIGVDGCIVGSDGMGVEAAAGGLPPFFAAPCFMPWYIMVIRGGMIGPCSGFEGS